MKHEKFMRHALDEARLALLEGEFPVGCVLVDGEQVVGRGHRKNSGGEQANELDHAEVVTLRSLLTAQPATDCSRLTLYSTMEPCLMCYATMLLSGIRRVVWAYEDVMGGATNLQLTSLRNLYAEMKVEIVAPVLRSESLRLFQEFFQRYPYWQDSQLAHYTLDQTTED